MPKARRIKTTMPDGRVVEMTLVMHAAYTLLVENTGSCVSYEEFAGMFSARGWNERSWLRNVVRRLRDLGCDIVSREGVGFGLGIPPINSGWLDDEIILAARMLVEGKTYQDVADAIGRSKNSVIGEFHRLGFATLFRRVAGSRSRWHPEAVQRLRELVAEGRLGTSAIAREFGCSRDAVQRQLRHMQLSLLPQPKPATMLRPKRGGGLVSQKLWFPERRAPGKEPARVPGIPELEHPTGTSGLQNEGCWSVIGRIGRIYYYCGEPCMTRATGDPSSYCSVHHHRFYTPIPARMKAA